MTSIPNVADIIATLEQNAPNIYTKCCANLVDKNGCKHQKKCVINLSTGDVFKNRAIPWAEQASFRLVRRYAMYNKSIETIELYAYQCAQEIDGNVFLTTWVFGDSYNNPNTTKFDWSWCGNNIVDQSRLGEKVDESALFNVKLSTPRIASIVIVTPNKKVLSWDNVEEFGLMDPDECYNTKNRYLSLSLLSSLHNATDAKHIVGLTEAFKSAFRAGYIGANKYVVFDSCKDVPVFMKAPFLEKKKSAKQTRIDDLAAIKLPDHSIVAMCENTICYADRVDNEWTVLRWYRKLQAAQYIETSRMYVNKADALHCRSDLRGNWVYAAAKIKAETFNADKIILQSDDVFDGTKLEYFKNVSTEIGNRSAALYMLTMYPEFEKMCKSGLGWLCDAYVSGPYQLSWKNFLDEKIGGVDWNAKNVFKMIGVNRHQIDKFAEFRRRMEVDCAPDTWRAYYLNGIISKMKRVFGVDSLNSIDDETFDYILDSFADVGRITGMYASALQITFEMYPKNAMYFIKDLNNAMQDKESVTLITDFGYRSSMSVDRLYFDTMRMIQSGNYTDVIKPRFSNVEELVNHHEVMVDLINADQREHEARANAQYNNGFSANHERWKKWEWDEDEKFCVIAPAAPIDIAIEGITLRHCVKSYIPSIANGRTNVVFIRRKGNETEPFFTVEVDNHNNIRQIHGMCNCNVGSVEGLVDFVKRWCKLKKLKYNQSYANSVRAAG